MNVTIKPNATVLEEGQTLLVPVQVACNPGASVLEAFVQQDVFGEVFHRRIVCDGTVHGSSLG